MDEDGSGSSHGKRQLKLSNVGFASSKRRSEEIESSGKGRCKFLEARKLEQVTHF
jgi:ribonuclease H2 subunit A